jgi:hypothetical protein
LLLIGGDWNMTGIFVHILGMSSSQLTNSYFTKGLFYHQPGWGKPQGHHNFTRDSPRLFPRFGGGAVHNCTGARTGDICIVEAEAGEDHPWQVGRYAEVDIMTGWWFGTFGVFFFPYIGKNIPI